MNVYDVNTRRDGEEPEVPAKLVAALKEPPPRRVFVPPTVDDAVLTAARRHLTKRPRLVFTAFRSWRVWPAAATACFVLACVALFVLRQPTSSRFAQGDVNHDGRVDILDAFTLARQLRANLQPLASPDLNGDGVVDRRDAEWIAAQAVKLEKGGRS